MAENFDLIFGQSAGSQYAWNDSDYQNGWKTVGSTPPTAEQFDALQRRSDTKAKDLNDRLSPLETKAEADGRQAATEYAEGVMVTADGLPNGWLLECVVPGTTDTGALVIPSPLVIGGTIVDGTVTWKINKEIGTSNVPLVAGYNQKQTFTSSGTFTAPVTGLYRITLQGAGGGGAGSSNTTYGNRGGGGGGQGGHYEFYAKLTAGTSYSYTIGAGGTAGAVESGGTAGGSSSITVGTNTYTCYGGNGGGSYGSANDGGSGGQIKVNDTILSMRGIGGGSGGTASNTGTATAIGGNGGAGNPGTAQTGDAGGAGAGGAGGGYNVNSGGAKAGGNGGDGYIAFEWLDTSLL